MLTPSRKLVLVLLVFNGIATLTTARSLFVTHDGDDLNCRRNWAMPCRSVRQAVKISNDGDRIYVDYALGKPYMECENVTRSTCPIELTTSLSFHGFNGRAELKCWRACTFFAVKTPSFHRTRTSFFDLILSSSDQVVKIEEGTRAELAFHNVLIKDNNYVIHSKHSTECSVLMTNSSFDENANVGIWLRCFNITVQIDSCKFERTPIYLTNPSFLQTRWQRLSILVRKTSFSGNFNDYCRSMVMVQPFAARLNITITDSVFRNFSVTCRNADRAAHKNSLEIFDHQSAARIATFVFLSNLLVKNIRTKWPAVYLRVGFPNHTEKTRIVIRDSIFRNNSMALKIEVKEFFGTKVLDPKKWPLAFLENNTFVSNICDQLKPNSAAAINFAYGRFRVLSCRFHDNGVSTDSYTGVVKISFAATVSFLNSYFENRQTRALSNQVFSSGRRALKFGGENTFNMVALKKSQTVFLRIPSVLTRGFSFSRKFRILCPQGYKLFAQRQCQQSAGTTSRNVCFFLNVRCEQCPAKTYTLERGEFLFNRSNILKCQQCPRGGDCGSGLVTAKPNFWGYRSKKKIVFVQCPPGYCCDYEDCDSYNSCHGNRAGTLCGQCREGMSENLFSTQCTSNEECFSNWFFIFGTIGMLVLYLVFFLYHKEIVRILRTNLFSKRLLFSINNRCNVSTSKDGKHSSSNGLIKIFFYYYQICSLLRSSVGSAKENKFIREFENFISRVLNMVLVNLPSFNCPFRNLRPIPKAIILHSVGYFLLVLLCLLYSMSKLFLFVKRFTSTNNGRTELQPVTLTRSPRLNKTFAERLASSFTYISLLMYASSTQLCLSLLHCLPVNDKQVLYLDGNVECYQTFQYFLFAYMISSVLPFCLVPVLGSYLLKSARIGVKQFFAASIIPLPFCCFWFYLMLKDFCFKNEKHHDTIEENDDAVRSDQENDGIESRNSDGNTFASNGSITKRAKSAILGVLLGPFRPHQALACFPSWHIPWEGFLIFRRLLLIIAMTFIYDIQLRLFVASTLCVVILIIHMFVNPFQRKSDNVLESFSLAAHVVLCSLTLIKALYYGEDYSAYSASFTVLNVIENILIFAPFSVVMIFATVSVSIKLVFGLKTSLLVGTRKIIRILRPV